MINIKNWKYFSNENTLVGEDISNEIKQIESLINDEIDEKEFLLGLKDIFNKRDILFANAEKISSIFRDFKKNDYNDSEYGIKLAFIANNLKIFVVIDEKELLYNLRKNKFNTLFTIKKILNHELVHREQYKKMGDKLDFILLNVKNSSYLDNPRELMAYAKSVIDELNRFFDKEQISEFLRKGFTVSPTQKNIKEKVKPENYKKFLKHMYNYNLQN
jgi:hypothetical protein